jgi:phospholipase/carboxylesterase
MRKTKIGALDVILTGGSDREGGGDGPVVVLLHGFGASGEDLVGLWRVLDVPRGTRFVFPAALLSLASEGFPGGRAWWRIDMAALQRGDRRLTTDVPSGLEPARAAVDAVLDHIENDWKVPASRVVLGGFSQGAMLSVDVSLRRKRALAGVAVMSGSVIAEEEWRALLGGARPTPLPPVFQSHGREDPLLPFATAEALRDALKESGQDVTFCPFRGGHEIPPVVLEGLGRFLTRALGPAA